MLVVFSTYPGDALLGFRQWQISAVLPLRKITLMDDKIIPAGGIVNQRQQDRIAALPAVYKTQYGRLAMELALGLDDPTTIFARHGNTTEQAAALLMTAEFSALLAAAEKEVKENGVSFRTKARALAEDLLPYGYEIATDDLASGAVRADLIQWFARVGGLEPPKQDGKQVSGGGLHLTINFSGEAPMKVVGNEPITIEAG